MEKRKFLRPDYKTYKPKYKLFCKPCIIEEALFRLFINKQ